MVFLREPSEARIRDFLAAQQGLAFSYPEVGASRTGAPRGYPVNHLRSPIGSGTDTFARAVEAIRQWKMYALPWTRLYWPDTSIIVSATVGVLACHFGFWSLNESRIIYVVEDDGVIQRYGFAFGTVPGHAEAGEERFTVEWHRQDDSVWYELFAFARACHLLAKAGSPLMRLVQKRFAVDSQRAMREATNGEGIWHIWCLPRAGSRHTYARRGRPHARLSQHDRRKAQRSDKMALYVSR